MTLAVFGLVITLALILFSILIFLGKLIQELVTMNEQLISISNSAYEILNWVAEKKEKGHVEEKEDV